MFKIKLSVQINNEAMIGKKFSFINGKAEYIITGITNCKPVESEQEYLVYCLDNGAKYYNVESFRKDLISGAIIIY
jgi:hypothetical protein